MLQLQSFHSGSCCFLKINKIWNDTVVQIFFLSYLSPDLVSSSLLRMYQQTCVSSESGFFKYLQLRKISLASSNISGFEKYLWLLQISLALKSISNFFKYLQLRKISPAPSNISSFEKYLQLLQISLASENISSFDYFRIHLISG